MQEEMLTLEKFEEASEIVKKVTLETKLVYSDYFSAQTGNRGILKARELTVYRSLQVKRRLLQNEHSDR